MQKNEVWIPTIITRHRGEAPVATTFVEIIEPYEGRSNIKAIRRLSLQTADGAAYGDNYVAIEVDLVDGQRDLIICADVDDALERTPSLGKSKMMIQPEWGVKTDGELSVVRRDASGKTIYTVLCRGRVLEAGELSTNSGDIRRLSRTRLINHGSSSKDCYRKANLDELSGLYFQCERGSPNDGSILMGGLVLAIGIQSRSVPINLERVYQLLGSPDLAMGNCQSGMVGWLMQSFQSTGENDVIVGFDVASGVIKDSWSNFGVPDCSPACDMVAFENSEMKPGT